MDKFAWNMDLLGTISAVVEDLDGNGGLSEAEANELILRNTVWDMSSTTLYDTYQTISKLDGTQSNLDPEEEAYRDALGEGLLCFINVAYPEWGGDKVVYTLTDYTDFSRYLETEAEGWSAIAIPPCPVFGWNEGDADMLKGQVSWTDYAGNVTIGSYSCGIANVVGASLQIVRN